MCIDDFFDLSNEERNKEYTYRILVYPNITFPQDLEKDSYVIVLKNMIEQLNKIRSDIFFTIISPSIIKSLVFNNTEQIIISFPSYPNTMRLHFNTTALLKSINWKNNSYDLVFSHLPEHTLQLKNLLYNTTDERPVFIGYTHWTEFKEITSYPETVIDINILGLMSMLACGINTQAQKDMVINYASERFKDVTKLDNILRPVYLGAERPKTNKNFVLPGVLKDKKIIVFNHRAHSYKNYDWFLKQMDEVYKTRKDFIVWVPLAETIDRPYITNVKFPRVDYFSCLKQSYIGVCCKQKYAGWSVSATDGMSVGLPYMFSDDGYYHELAGDAGVYYKNENDFIIKLNMILDTPAERKKYSLVSLKRSNLFTWENNIIPVNDMINNAILTFPIVKNETDTYKKIYDYIKNNKNVTKGNLLKHLGWGVGIPFSSYRNRLRLEKDILFTKNGYLFK